MWSFGIENVVPLITRSKMQARINNTLFVNVTEFKKKKVLLLKKKNVLLDAFSYFMPYPNVDYVITLFLVYSLYLQN